MGFDNDPIVKNLLKKRKKIDYDKIDKKIRKKFGEDLDRWKIIESHDDLKLEKGYHITYIDNEIQKKVKALYIHSMFTKEGNLFKILLKNVYTGVVWTVSPNNYYFYKEVSTSKSELRKWLEEVIGEKIIDDSLDNGDSDIKDFIKNLNQDKKKK